MPMLITFMSSTPHEVGQVVARRISPTWKQWFKSIRYGKPPIHIEYFKVVSVREEKINVVSMEPLE